MFGEIIGNISGFMYGKLLVILLIAVGLYFTFRTKFVQFRFFGESITVAGLLTGKDICDQLDGVELGDELLVPATALRADDEDFLCGMTLKELSHRLGVKATPVGSDGYGFAEAVFGICQ